MSNVNKNYIEKLQEELPEKESKLLQMKMDIDDKVGYKKSIGLFTCPFEYYESTTASLLSDEVNFNWKKYKKNLYDRWWDPYSGRKMISQGLDRILLIAFAGLTLGFSIFAIIMGWNKLLQLSAVPFLIFMYAVFEYIAFTVSTWYYVIRPNIVNKRITGKEIKALSKEYKILSNEIKTNKGMIDAYELSRINPDKEFANMRKGTAEALQTIINDTIENVLPSIKNEYNKKYRGILDKCQKLLDMSLDNGSRITEISKIYNIYINEINYVLNNSDAASTNDIMTMLNNFESYIDRKITKFDQMHKTSIDSNISALNSAFTED